MANPYRILFQASGTRAFSLAGLLARLPLPMTGIGIITMLSQLRGSYALAGAVSATFVITYALMSPQVSRMVDRYGQRRVLPLSAGLSVVGLLLLLACTHWHTPDWTLFLAAVSAGFMPSMSAMVRARWTAIYRGKPHLQTAYSLETVLDEVTFIAGPPISVGLSVVVFPQAGPLAAVVMLAVGVIVGTVDIVSVAFAEHVGSPAAASIVLSCYAIGSCAAGLLFGALKLKIPLHRLLLLGGLATAATTLPLLIAGNIASLSAAVLAAGLFFAPTMIVAMSLVERIVPERQLTEGMTWLLAGLNVGVAMGAAVSGQLVDIQGARYGFNVALAAGAAVLLVAIWGHRRMREHSLRQACVL